jgi:hypothetical protein
MMWNWKLIHEDDEFVIYCDIENVVGMEEDDEGSFPSAECYQSIPDKVAVWVSIGLKKPDTLKTYIRLRKKVGLPVEGYEHYDHTLGLVEVDALKGLYRVIPAIDFNEMDVQLGTSSLLAAEGGIALKGIAGDWSKVNGRMTSKAIKSIFKFFYPPVSPEC